MSNRIDEVEKYYKPIEFFNALAAVFFYGSVLLSLTVPVLMDLLDKSIVQYGTIVFVILVVLHSFTQNLSAFYLLPRAEIERRKQLLSNSLGVPLTHSQTNQYYNNEREVGLKRLSANLMENSFFGKNICLAMLKPERIKVTVYAVLLLFILLSRDADLGVIIVLTQIFFAGGILFNWVKLEVLRIKNERVYDSLYRLHLSQQGILNSKEVATLLDIFAEYECAKSSASIKLSSKVFNKLNEGLTEEWNSIKRTIHL